MHFCFVYVYLNVNVSVFKWTNHAFSAPRGRRSLDCGQGKKKVPALLPTGRQMGLREGWLVVCGEGDNRVVC